ncbi:hypothetical protein FNV43_RR27157 [Rhamnella rubrinervis]|uniref:UvrD-like helicase ATP-binding domain-containing protein n=1 Tax=Rhamnella rubrinervis TaxID=2594499 RepID=A0A8K0GKC1_9ROSA|nr:hypothetical protein FNV43_RR27157 [Rhamnella rubrinervis]
MDNEYSNKNQSTLIDLVFSWSFQDIFNHQLYKTQVQEIPVSFVSEQQYFEALKFPLLAETRAELSSSLVSVFRAPYGRIECIQEHKQHGKSWVYKLKVDHWRNTSNGVYGKGSPYKVLPGHVFVFTDEKPETISDLEAVLGRKWSLAMAGTVKEDDDDSFVVEASCPCVVGENDAIGKPLYLVFLMNIKTNERIWNALHMNDNLSTIRKVLFSEVSAKAGLVRSFFERLSKKDGVPKAVLNMQNRILDDPKVGKNDYSKLHLPGPLFVNFSFINISCGKEEMDDVLNSRKNMLEVAVVIKIVGDLFEAWKELKQQSGIVVTSPYTAQVHEIQKRLEQKYKKFDRFKVKVKPINILQGQEEDIIVLSTVLRLLLSVPSLEGSILASDLLFDLCHRHGLWILGNERALSESESVWKYIVRDARDRQCFFNADEDENFAKFIMEVKKEMDQFDEILDKDSFHFRNPRWEVLFSQNFKNSFEKIKSLQTKKLVIYLLGMLASGWRPKKRNIDIICNQSRQILKQFKVQDLYIVCSVDVVQKSCYIQVLKVWDILPLVDIQELVKQLDAIFCTYTDDFLKCCKKKCLEGDLEVPMSWETSYGVVRYKRSCHIEDGIDSSTGALNITSSSSLLLMKFYALSSSIASHLLSGCDGEEIEFPFELSSQEMEIIHFNRSSFVLGRSGTGKTTVLIGKLIQREQLHHIALEGFHELNSSNSNYISMEDKESAEETKGSLLRQIFVTLSPKLCYAVKQNVSGLKRFSCKGYTKEYVTAHLDDTDGMIQFTDIPDSFVDLPSKFYPLVVTFHKFLMMLNGTIGSSFFNSFPEARGFSLGNTRNSMSLALRTFIRRNEVNFDKFESSYWPHFSVHLTKRLIPSVVFTEIMSHIKGGSQAGVATDVIDLHRRFRENKYEGDKLDFVYVDEVQDLTTRQISLFKYVCRNVSDGFVFSGDTAQTIARGVDFRFQDIRSTFYKVFLTISSCDNTYKKSKHVRIVDTFQLSHNFRTHAGVLKLAQSVIDLIYHFFPLSIDVLNPETSFVDGKTPVLVESVNCEKAFTDMFGGIGGPGNDLVGFGAEQVVLVRDDNIRNKISDSIARHALVLTIMECKGLEFQDVLLYNFLGSSPLKNEWRVIYEYMNEKNLLDSPKSFPSFDEAKHKLLCFELKQLYVAITRTRQRLWIFENMEDHSKPVLDYWKKLKIVEVGEFNGSLVEDIQVTSSKEEWNSRGVKLFYENDYKSAMMCFQKAGNTFYEKWVEATSLVAAGRRISGSNSKMAHVYLKKAAELFDSIGKYEPAAQCYYDLNEYEKAGTIYLEKCDESKLEEAGECFTRARCYDRASFAYAKGKLYSNCLAACIQGKLFDEGLNYINLRRNEDAALSYKNRNDNSTMLKFVRAFTSVDLMRSFLSNNDCLDELIQLESEWGYFLNASRVAKQMGDLLLEAELLEKVGEFREASSVILLHVFANSLWAEGNNGWPMKHFTRRKELFDKAKDLAKNVSDYFFEFNIEEILQYLRCLENQSALGEFCLNYLGVRRKFWNGKDSYLVFCSDAHWVKPKDNPSPKRKGKWINLKPGQFANAAVNYWWSEMTTVGMKVLEKLEALFEFSIKAEFPLHRQNSTLMEMTTVGVKVLEKLEALYEFSIKAEFSLHRLNSTLNEMTTVGMKVLEKLEALSFSIKAEFPLHRQNSTLIHMLKVSNSLMKLNFLHNMYKLWDYFDRFIASIFGTIFPLDWRQSSVKNMINLWEVREFRDFFRNIFNMCISKKSQLTHEQVGNLVMTIIGASNELSRELYEQISSSLVNRSPWRPCIKSLVKDLRPELQLGSSSSMSNPPEHVSLDNKFLEALKHYCFTDWKIGFATNGAGSASLKIDSHRRSALRYDCILTTQNWSLGNTGISSKLPSEFCTGIERLRPENVGDNINVIAEAFEKIGNPLVAVKSGKDCLEFKCPEEAIFVDLTVH